MLTGALLSRQLRSSKRGADQSGYSGY